MGADLEEGVYAAVERKGSKDSQVSIAASDVPLAAQMSRSEGSGRDSPFVGSAELRVGQFARQRVGRGRLIRAAAVRYPREPDCAPS